ncbi:hypothetical protein SUGI_0662070 [Cryptomeria japonica]|nr:hypothetical protein SUGI_0662070 [Cryptomeria japonica]
MGGRVLKAKGGDEGCSDILELVKHASFSDMPLEGANDVVEAFNLDSTNIVAKFLKQGDDTQLFTGPVRGIFGYMFPEYVASGNTTDADVFIFGVVICSRMVTDDANKYVTLLCIEKADCNRRVWTCTRELRERIANGDSRVVLSTADNSIALSAKHKPMVEDNNGADGSLWDAVKEFDPLLNVTTPHLVSDALDYFLGLHTLLGRSS